jgi:tetratricopeptide (TPR) repeat protein
MAGRLARLWDAPAPLPDDVPRLAAWVETATGLELDERGSIRVLDGTSWRERLRLLEELGGPPQDLAPKSDPILFGAHPEARGDALAARGLWERAEAAYAEAAAARPLNACPGDGSVWDSRTRFYVSRGRPECAASALDEAVSRWPDSLFLRWLQCHALLAAGDRIGWERAIASLLDRFRGPMSFEDQNNVAWLCSLGPSTVDTREIPVRLAESVVQGMESEKANALHTLGAALYRAGLFNEAIQRLEQSIQAGGGGQGTDGHWPLLAMAHHRLGNYAESRRWLHRLQNHRGSTQPNDFWDELAIRLLRSEAEAVILYDPAFPDHPFAP